LHRFKAACLSKHGKNSDISLSVKTPLCACFLPTRDLGKIKNDGFYRLVFGDAQGMKLFM
jgi:hypothetical protein